jgi:histidine phosphotransferase ChpT
MSVQLELRVVELLCARLCHELVSPIGAINNGVELLGEEDPEFVKDAIALIGQSARKGGQRLQFYRFAYGTSGAGAASGAASTGRDLAIGLLEGGKVQCEWPAEAITLPADWQRLACNMLVLAAESLPRGGLVGVRPLRAGASGIEVVAAGDSVNLTTEARSALDGSVAVDDLTSRTVHAYFTGRLAAQLGARLAVALPEPGRVVFTASAG